MSDERTIPQRAMVESLRSLRVDVLGEDGRTHAAEQDQLTIGTAEGNDLVLSDPTVSRFHAELTRTDRGVLVVDHGSTNGTFAGGVRIERAVVPAGSVLALGDSRVRVSDGEAFLPEELPGTALAGLRGRTPVMRRLMAQVARLAATQAPVLLLGESGTGKELLAKALHELGPRRDGPFVVVDCGSLSPGLVASELFGHERGAFTGADRTHAGAFERASGGTVFLDEIGELPVHLQPSLLGVLERRRFRRVGGRSDVAVDVRVVAATHRDLRADVNAGTFRLDLYYRVAVALLRVPPLRERADDLPLLIEHFAREAGCFDPIARWFPAGAMEALVAHHWPGNVRELRNVVEATIATGELAELPGGAFGRAPAQTNDAGEEDGDPFAALYELGYKEARATLLEAFERRYLTRILARAGGNVSRAARESRIDRSHLIDLIKRHELETKG